MREPIAGVSRPQWISEKAGETPAGRGDVESWWVGAGRIQHAQDLEAVTLRKQGEGGERKGGAEVIACRVPHVDIK